MKNLKTLEERNTWVPGERMSFWNDINCSFIDKRLRNFISLNKLSPSFYSVLYPSARFWCSFDCVTLYIKPPSASPLLNGFCTCVPDNVNVP